MTVTHTQSVVIEVHDDQHHARFERAIENHWPGHAVQPITELIRETAEELIRAIEAAERNE